MAGLHPSAFMDVVSCHVSYEVDGHQCSQSACCLHCYSSAANTHSVIDPVNVGGGEEASEIETAVAGL